MKALFHFKLFIILLALITSACSESNLEQTQTGITAEQQSKVHDLILTQQFQSVSLAIGIVNDISGSYRINPESLDFDILFKTMPSCQGRVVVGYTHIDEDSYDPIIRYNYIPLLQTEMPKSNDKTNAWIESEKTKPDNNVYNHVNQTIDSLNMASLALFSNKVAEKLNRNTARRSDVVFALKRASSFLCEFSDCPRILVVCSDFKDTYKRSMNLDPSITLFVIGSNVLPRDVKASTGIDPTGYRLFESYEEALNHIAKYYMYNSKK